MHEHGFPLIHGVVAGQNITHTITVTNLGPSIATAVVVRDNLPAEVTMVSATPSAGQCVPGTPGNAALPLTCTLGNMASGAINVITVVSRVRSNTPNGTVLANGASVSGTSTDPNNANNIQTAFTNVTTQADLALAKTADAATYKPNTTVTYRIVATTVRQMLKTSSLSITCRTSGLPSTCRIPADAYFRRRSH